MMKVISAVLVSALLLVFLVGCGGNEQAETGPPAGEHPTSEEPTTEQPELPAGEHPTSEEPAAEHPE